MSRQKDQRRKGILVFMITGKMMLVIQQATTADDLDDVRDLFRAFVRWHRQRHVEDIRLIDKYFDQAAFDYELDTLPGKYAPPRGRLLLARYEGRPAGCVALREIDERTCEMKRMFVYDEFRGKRFGLALAESLIRDAAAIGYERMLLDTSVRQQEAQTLYRRLGFRDIDSYYEVSEEVRDWLVFMELPLRSQKLR